MTAPLAIWLFIFVAAGVAAFAGTALLHAKAHPRTQLLSWLMTTAVAAIGIGWVAAIGGASLPTGLTLVLILSPLTYPALLLWGMAEDLPYQRQREDKAVADARRAIRLAADRQARDMPTPPPARPVRPAAPIPPAVASTSEGLAPLPALAALPPLAPVGALAQVTADPKSLRARLIAGGFVIAMVGFMAWHFFSYPVWMIATAPKRVAAHREMVVAQLGVMGLQNVRLERDMVQLYCTGGDGEAYAWRSDAADGRACVRDAGVQIKVERSRLTKDPFARPAKP